MPVLGENLPNFENLKLHWYSNIQYFTECPSEIIEDDANFRVFLTINALTIFDWSGNLQQRKLELNWTPPPDGVQNGDWIGNYTSGCVNRLPAYAYSDYARKNVETFCHITRQTTTIILTKLKLTYKMETG